MREKDRDGTLLIKIRPSVTGLKTALSRWDEASCSGFAIPTLSFLRVLDRSLLSLRPPFSASPSSGIAFRDQRGTLSVLEGRHREYPFSRVLGLEGVEIVLEEETPSSDESWHLLSRWDRLCGAFVQSRAETLSVFGYSCPLIGKSVRGQMRCSHFSNASVGTAHSREGYCFHIHDCVEWFRL